MPDVDWNKSHWSEATNWSAEGEEWSTHWGSSFIQWHYTILPRIAACVPAPRIVEIAPGFGRWTRFLLPLCDSYRGYDLSAPCVEACASRFAKGASRETIDFVVNDGATLSHETDQSVDFVFSFDSLVHAEQAVLTAYLKEIARVLKPGGRAFLHHSNLAALPRNLKHYMHERGADVDADSVATAAEAAGLQVPVQETVTWNIPVNLDCFTLLAKPVQGQAAQPARHVINNAAFWDDVERHREILQRYSGK